MTARTPPEAAQGRLSTATYSTADAAAMSAAYARYSVGGTHRIGSTALYRDIAERVLAGHRHLVLQHLDDHVLLVVEIDDLAADLPLDRAPTPVH